MDGWMDGQTDRQTDGQTHRQTHTEIHVDRCIFLISTGSWYRYSQTCVNRPLSKGRKLVFKTNYSLNLADHSAILSTFIKLH